MFQFTILMTKLKLKGLNMYKHLTYVELCTIWHHKVNKSYMLLGIKRLTVNELAKLLGKNRSTIYRAINYIKGSKFFENSNPPVIKFRERQHKIYKLKQPKVIKYIQDKLEIGWSPEVISGRIYKDIKIRISFKTIYRYIWEIKLSGGKLHKLLSHQGKRYKYGNPNRCSIKDRVDISSRPAIVEKKKRIGDIEGDTVVGIKGGNKDCLLTLVDRVSKYTIIRKLLNKTALSVENAMNDSYDNSLLPFITVTYDNGTEFANHKNIANNLGCAIYFARPYRSCDRGLNEHTNGLIRRFFPKKTDFANINETQIEHVQNLLNNRPRKSLGFLTPNEVVNKYLTRSYKKLSQFT
jgi:IS30 family transposase